MPVRQDATRPQHSVTDADCANLNAKRSSITDFPAFTLSIVATNTVCLCMCWITFVFCVPVPRVMANLPVSPAHMLIPWFSTCSRSNVGHNPLCVFAPGSVIWNDRITGERDTVQCLGGRTVGTCYSALHLCVFLIVCLFLYVACLPFWNRFWCFVGINCFEQSHSTVLLDIKWIKWIFNPGVGKQMNQVLQKMYFIAQCSMFGAKHWNWWNHSWESSRNTWLYRGGGTKGQAIHHLHTWPL